MNNVIFGETMKNVGKYRSKMELFCARTKSF